jgi:Lar family restriction alleviation protein
MTTELKLCPFCGGKAGVMSDYHEGGYYVLCDECCAEGSVCNSEEDAAAAWNRRSSEVAIEAAVLARVAPKEPVTAMSPELDAATLWLAEARDTLRRLGDDANRHLTAVLYAAMDASHQEGAKLQTDGREKG